MYDSGSWYGVPGAVAPKMGADPPSGDSAGAPDCARGIDGNPQLLFADDDVLPLPLLGAEGAPLGDGRRVLLAAGELSGVKGLRLFADEGGGILSPSFTVGGCTRLVNGRLCPNP